MPGPEKRKRGGNNVKVQNKKGNKKGGNNKNFKGQKKGKRKEQPREVRVYWLLINNILTNCKEPQEVISDSDDGGDRQISEDEENFFEVWSDLVNTYLW